MKVAVASQPYALLALPQGKFGFHRVSYPPKHLPRFDMGRRLRVVVR